MTDANPRTCAYPGCDVVMPAAGPHGGPPPRYCDDPDHNAHSVYRALARGEGEVEPQVAARIGLAGGSDG